MSAETSGAESEAYSHWRQNGYALAAAAFLLSIGFGIAGPFLPLVAQEMGVSEHVETWVGWVLGGYFGLSFFLTPVWGVVADHYGRKAMVLRTSFGMGVLTLLMPFAPNLSVFAILYLLMGTTNGFIPSCQALVATTTSARRLGSSLALVQTGALLGGAIGPAVGAYAAGLVPRYRDLFFVNAGLVFGAGLLALLFARERFRRPAAPFRPHLWQDLRVIVRIPNAIVLYLVMFATTITYYGSSVIVTVYALELLKAAGSSSAAEVNFWVGAVSVAFTAASAACVPVWGKLMDRLGAPRVLTLSLLLGGLATMPVVFVQSVSQLAAARFLAGAFVVGMGPASLAIIKARSPRGMEGRVLSYSAAFGSLGMGMGPFVAGQIGPWLGLRAFFVLNSVLILVLLGAWWRSWERSRGLA
jgi:DHA1 family multidrug resistance protein-like MFS transporter